MVINYHRRFVFLAVPRTASKAMTSALMTHAGSVRRPGERHRMDIPSDAAGFYVFCCVRNPYSRLASHWKRQHLRGRFPGTFGDFVAACETGSVSERSQCRWLGSNRALVDTFLRFEGLPDCLAAAPPFEGLELQVMDRSGLGDWRTLYDQALADRVERWCSQDFDVWDYDRESWRQA
jgi:hypothetical protein